MPLITSPRQTNPSEDIALISMPEISLAPFIFGLTIVRSFSRNRYSTPKALYTVAFFGKCIPALSLSILPVRTHSPWPPSYEL